MRHKRMMSAVFVALALCSVNVSAQSQSVVPHYPTSQLSDSLMKGVALTDSQKIKVEAIARAYWELMHANDARMQGAPRDTIRAFLRALRERQATDLRRLLTPAQVKTFDANRAPVATRPLIAPASADTIRMPLQWKISSEESGAGQDLGVLSSLVVDALGNTYVADNSAITIRVFGASGQPFRNIGRKGDGPGEFVSPAGLGIGPDGMLYVRDQLRHSRFRRDPDTKRLTVYDGAVARPAMSDWQTRYPVKFVSAENFFDPNFSRFSRPPKFSGRYYRYSTLGKVVDSVMVPLLPNSPPAMTMLRISAGSARGFPGLNHVPFAPIPVWELSATGTLLVGNNEQYLLTERDYSGKVLHTYQRNARPEPIPARERVDSVAALQRRIDSLPVPISRLEGVPPNVARLDLPQTFPFYSAVFSATDGKVWVRRWVRGSAKRTVFDVFEREGKFLTTVVLPIVISSDVQPSLTLDRIVAVVVDADSGENMLYSFANPSRR